MATGLPATRASGRSQAGNIAAARAQLSRDLEDLAAGTSGAARNQRRIGQVARFPQARVFTHSSQRGLVTDSLTGRYWDLRTWRQGRFGNAGAFGGQGRAGG